MMCLNETIKKNIHLLEEFKIFYNKIFLFE